MIVGQKKALNFLNKLIETESIGSSLLFIGPEGVGKFTTALWLAKKLNCPNKKNALDDFCGSCSVCKRIDKLIHPDVQIIKLVSDYLRIDQFRQMQKDIVYSPLEGKFKFYIITDAHLMTESAANSLLKILEEPPSYAVIILITPQAWLLFPTIISRCQRIMFSHLSQEEVKKYLKEKFSVANEKEDLLLWLSGGSLGKLHALSKDEKFLTLREASLEKLAVFFESRGYQVLEVANWLESQKNQANQILEFFLSWYRDLLIIKSGAPSSYLINKDKTDALKSQLNLYTILQIERALKEILETRRLLKRKLSWRLLSLNLILNLAGLRDIK